MNLEGCQGIDRCGESWRTRTISLRVDLGGGVALPIKGQVPCLYQDCPFCQWSSRPEGWILLPRLVSQRILAVSIGDFFHRASELVFDLWDWLVALVLYLVIGISRLLAFLFGLAVIICLLIGGYFGLQLSSGSSSWEWPQDSREFFLTTPIGFLVIVLSVSGLLWWLFASALEKLQSVLRRRMFLRQKRHSFRNWYRREKGWLSTP